MFKFLWEYASGSSLLQCSARSGFNYGSSSFDWGNTVRHLFVEYYVRHIRTRKLAGDVEIDESMFGRKVKYHRGQPRGHKIWIVGMAERETNFLKLFPVDNRSEETLMSLVKEHMQEGSKVHTDAWKGSANLSSHNYCHMWLEHKYEFK
jgi:transposase-like protein